MKCPRCEESVEPKYRTWEIGPDGIYCPDCGYPLHETLDHNDLEQYK